MRPHVRRAIWSTVASTEFVCAVLFDGFFAAVVYATLGLQPALAVAVSWVVGSMFGAWVMAGIVQKVMEE